MFSQKFCKDYVVLLLFLWLVCPFFAIQNLHAEPIKTPIGYEVYAAIEKIEGSVFIPVSGVGELPTLEEVKAYASLSIAKRESAMLMQNTGCTAGRPCTAFISVTATGTGATSLIVSSGNNSIYINFLYLGETTANGAATQGSVALFETSSGGGTTAPLLQLTGFLQSSGSGTGTSITITASGGNIMVAPASATASNNPVNLIIVNTNARNYAGWITYYLSS